MKANTAVDVFSQCQDLDVVDVRTSSTALTHPFKPVIDYYKALIDQSLDVLLELRMSSKDIMDRGCVRRCRAALRPLKVIFVSQCCCCRLINTERCGRLWSI